MTKQNHQRRAMEKDKGAPCDRNWKKREIFVDLARDERRLWSAMGPPRKQKEREAENDVGKVDSEGTAGRAGEK